MYKMRHTELFKNEYGQVAILFGLVLIPLVAVAGFAIDFQQTVKRKAKAQLIMDSAVLAAARVKQTGASNDQVKLAVQQFMDGQLNGLPGLSCTPAIVTVSTTDEEIDAQMRCRQTTSLMQVLGQDHMPFNVISGSEYGIDKIDVAFMFDVSGSMNSSNRLSNLKLAAQDAVDILLPVDATPELIENTRLAMVSYNGMVDAGDYFEDVTGVTPTRTYTHEIAGYGPGDYTVGNTFDDFLVGLYDTDTGDLISEIGKGASIEVQDHQDDDLTIAVTMDPSHDLYGQVESMRLRLSGTEANDKRENVEPYAMYGDSGTVDSMNGEPWDMGDFTLRLQAYRNNSQSGTKLFDETFDFTLVREGGSEPETKTYTLTSTCVWERDGPFKFTDLHPVVGGYLSHSEAWFVEDSDHSNGGTWEVGHRNRPFDNKYDGDECRDIEPVELTNNRTTLSNYITSLPAGGWTAGHLGVAWTWYLISEDWNTIFTGDAAPLDYTEPDSAKIVILMTDGAFNTEIYPEQGNSDAQARDVCDNMKLKDVKVYSVALNAPSSGKAVLEYCATGPSYYFEPETGAELKEAYRQIAVSISDLRISK